MNILKQYINTNTPLPYGLMVVDKIPSISSKKSLPMVSPVIDGKTITILDYILLECTSPKVKTQIAVCASVNKLSDGMLYTSPYLMITTDYDYSDRELEKLIPEWWKGNIGNCFQVESEKYIKMVNCNMKKH